MRAGKRGVGHLGGLKSDGDLLDPHGVNQLRVLIEKAFVHPRLSIRHGTGMGSSGSHRAGRRCGAPRCRQEAGLGGPHTGEKSSDRSDRAGAGRALARLRVRVRVRGARSPLSCGFLSTGGSSTGGHIIIIITSLLLLLFLFVNGRPYHYYYNIIIVVVIFIIGLGAGRQEEAAQRTGSRVRRPMWGS